MAVVVIGLSSLPAIWKAWDSNSHSARGLPDNRADALTFRVAAELLLQGESPYDPEQHARHIARTRLGGETPPYTLPFAYPPNALPLFLIYAVGPPRCGFLLFVLLGTLAMLTAAWILTGRFVPGIAARSAIVAALGLSGPAVFNGELGQTAGYLTAAIFLYVALYNSRPVLAGVALGLMVFKPQYALPLGVVALAEGRWRIIAGEAGTFAACSLISGLLFGFETWGAFLDALGRANDTVDYMSNWYAWAFLAGAKPSVQIAGIPVMAAGALLIAAYAASVPAGANAWLHKLAFAAALAPIVSANTHPYDLSFLVFPVLAAVWLHGGRWRIVRALQTERSNAATIAVVVVLFCSTTTFLLTHRPMLLAVELLVLVAVVAVRLRSATTQHVPGEHTTLSRPPTYTTAGTAETSACAE